MPHGLRQPLHETVQALFRCRRFLWWAAHRALAARNQTMWEWQLLAHARHGAVSQNRLAEATAQHPTAVSRLLTGMEREGLIRRVRAVDDRRCVQVELTEAGQARYLSLADPVWATLGTQMEVLAPEEMAELQRLLGKILAHGAAPAGERPSAGTSRDAGA